MQKSKMELLLRGMRFLLRNEVDAIETSFGHDTEFGDDPGLKKLYDDGSLLIAEISDAINEEVSERGSQPEEKAETATPPYRRRRR
jgi:hypothetical protein